MKKPKPLNNEYTPDFLIFWKGFPSRWNSNLNSYVKRRKFPAFESWQKLTPEVRQKCLRIVKKIRLTEGTPRDCVTWLNQIGWDDIDEPDLDAQSLPQSMTDSLKRVPDDRIKVNESRNKQRKELLK